MAFSPTVAGQPPQAPNLQVKVSQRAVQKVESVNYLGVMVDQHLKWKLQINSLVKRLRRSIHIFYSLRSILNYRTMLQVYTAMIESVLRYGIVVWGCVYPTTLYPLQIAQNYILRTMYNKENTFSTKLLYSESRILDVRDLYIMNSLIFIHSNPALRNYPEHLHVTRTQTHLSAALPRCGRVVEQRSIHYLGIKMYNSIPMEIRSSYCVHRFRRLLKQYILAHKEELKNLLRRLQQ